MESDFARIQKICRETKYFPFRPEVFENSSVEPLGDGVFLVHGPHFVDLDTNMRQRVLQRVRWTCEGYLKHLKAAPQVWLCLSEEPKVVRMDRAEITSHGVNSAFTLMGGTGPVIVIYRREELLKVLVHELLHHAGFDLEACDKLDLEFRAALGWGRRDRRVLVIEALVEYFAVLLHGLYLLWEGRIRGLREYLESERRWSRCNAEKLRQIYASWEHKVQDTTHAFSYFVIKSILLDRLDAEDFQTTMSLLSSANTNTARASCTSLGSPWHVVFVRNQGG